MSVDINRGTAGVVLPKAISSDIWSKTIDESAVMRLSHKMTLPGQGLTIPVITGDAQAYWTKETDEATASKSTFGSKDMSAHKLTVLEPFSNEFKRDMGGLYTELARRLPKALGSKFDSTVFGTVAPGDNFDVLGNAAAVGISGKTYSGIVAVDQAVATGGGILNGFALSPQARGLLLNAVDGQGRPLFINNVTTDGAVPALLGAPVFQTKGVYKAGTPNQLGFAGDWSSAHYGTVEGIKVSVSDQATITVGDEQINLWQRGMFAIKAEIEVGFVVRDIAHFARLTDAEQV